MTLERFEEIFSPLAIQLRANDVDEATIRVYYRILEPIDESLVQLAAHRLAQSSEWFPKSSEWLAMTRTIERERQGLLADRIRDLHRRGLELCYSCGDTGWSRDEATNKVTRCECQSMRRLEVLGRRPIPALPA